MPNDFKEILNRVKKILKTDTDGDVAKAINISINAFSNRKRSGSIPYSEFVHLAEERNVNLNWLFYGQGPMYKKDIAHSGNTTPKDPEKDPPEKSNITKVIIEHQKLLTLFKDQERAKEINENLIEIEQISDELMESIAQHIKSSLSAARVIKGPSKKKSGDTDQDNYQNGKSA